MPKKSTVIDLKRDSKVVRKYVLQRVKEYPVYENLGPGSDDDLIRLITLGFEFDQKEPGISLVFDTRLDAKNDEEWSKFTEDNLLRIEHWNDLPCELVSIAGAKSRVKSDCDEVVVAKMFGVMLADTLCSCREQLFKLPVANDCELCVIDHYGAYDSLERLDVSHPEKKDVINRRMKGLSKKKQCEFWIGELEKCANDRPSELDDLEGVFDGQSTFGERVAVRRLVALGAPGITGLLEFCLKWASTYEYHADGTEHRISKFMSGALLSIGEASKPTPKLKSRLQGILRAAVKANAKKEVEGGIPVNAARVLHQLFGYPFPKYGLSHRPKEYAEFLK